MQGLADGIKNAITAPIRAAKNAATKVSEGIRSKLKIKSPSRVMMEYGEYTTEGLAVGMEDKIPRLEEVVGTTYNVITQEETKINKVNRTPFKPIVTDDPGPKPKPQVALAGSGQSITIVQIDNIDVETGTVNENASDEDLREIVEEAQEEFGKKLLEALRDKNRRWSMDVYIKTKDEVFHFL